MGGWPNGGDGYGSCGNGGGGGSGWYGGGGGGQLGAQENSGSGGGGSSFPMSDLSNVNDITGIELLTVSHATTTAPRTAAGSSGNSDYTSGVGLGGTACGVGGDGMVVVTAPGSTPTVFSYTGSLQTFDL